MIVRCGACRTQFDVPGEGRFACPVCGSVNMVRGRSGGTGPGGAPPPGSMPPTGGPEAGDYGTPQQPSPSSPPPPPPPPPDEPSPKVECSECGFAFIVGDIAVAVCPMCSAEVPTGKEAAEEND